MGRKRLMELGWSHEDTIKWEKNPSRTPTGVPPGGLEMRTNGPQGSIRSTAEATAAAVRQTRAVVGNTRY